MGRAPRLVPAVVAALLALAPAASAATTSGTTASTTTTTVAGSAPNTAKCGVVLGAGARWMKTTSPCEVAVSLGKSVSVNLSAHYRWGGLRSSTAAVVSVASTHPGAGGLTGSLRARALGLATISSTGAPICPKGQACPDYVLLWTLRVKVVAPTPVPKSVTVTEADAGTSVTVSKGQDVVISLTGSATYTWSTPTATDPTVLERLSGSPGHAVFKAVGVGSTTVTATESPDCYPGCLPPSKLIQFRIFVQ